MKKSYLLFRFSSVLFFSSRGFFLVQRCESQTSATHISNSVPPPFSYCRLCPLPVVTCIFHPSVHPYFSFNSSSSTLSSTLSLSLIHFFFVVSLSCHVFRLSVTSNESNQQKKKRLEQAPPFSTDIWSPKMNHPSGT